MIVPGGFSFGDYLRCGAIARFSPIMNDLKEFGQKVDIFSVFAMDFRSCVSQGFFLGL